MSYDELYIFTQNDITHIAEDREDGTSVCGVTPEDPVKDILSIDELWILEIGDNTICKDCEFDVLCEWD